MELGLTDDVTPTNSLLSFAELSQEEEHSSQTYRVSKEIPFTRNERIAQIIFLTITGSTLVTSTYFANQEMKEGIGNNQKYSLFMWSSGGSLALFCHALLPSQLRKKVYGVMSAWIYETYFVATTVFLNLSSEELRKHLEGLFFTGAGFFQLRDIATFFSLSRTDFEQTLRWPENENELIPLFPPNTRNRTIPKFTLTANLIFAAIITGTFFMLRDRYSDDLHKEGLYGNMAAAYTGSVLGEILARIFDDLKELAEIKHRATMNPGEELPFGLKAARTVKRLFSLLAPIGTGFLLQHLSRPSKISDHDTPNSVIDYIANTAIGGIYGAQYLLLKRECENPLSTYNMMQKSINEKKLGTIESTEISHRIYNWAKTYIPSLLCFGGLDSFMIIAGLESERKILAAIIALLVSSHLSFLATDYIVRNHSPKTMKDIRAKFSTYGQIKERVLNEIHFRLTTPVLLATPYQYATTKFNITDEHMRVLSQQLFFIAIITWIFWGITWGNQRALYVHKKQDQGTPPMVSTEFGKNTGKGFGS